MSSKTYDCKCYDLAEAFIDDVPDSQIIPFRGDLDAARKRLANELAAAIQQAIEDFLENHELEIG